MYFPGKDSEKLAQKLQDEQGFVSFRDSIRISPHLYNDENDIGRMIEVMDTVLK
jgi:selenocysteine lyase/cysteine desulfurase